MILEDISRALYALPSGVVVERRQPVYRPMLIAVVGAVLLVVNFLLVDDKSGAMGNSKFGFPFSSTSHSVKILLQTLLYACNSVSFQD